MVYSVCMHGSSAIRATRWGKCGSNEKESSNASSRWRAAIRWLRYGGSYKDKWILYETNNNGCLLL